jgi:hypothetical protein
MYRNMYNTWYVTENGVSYYYSRMIHTKKYACNIAWYHMYDIKKKKKIKKKF